MAAAPAAGAPGNDGIPRVVKSRAELVRLWEDLIDKDTEAARELFFAALLRDARAEYTRRARKGHGHKDEEQQEQRRARVFQPWEPPAPGSALPLPPPPQPVAAAPRVERVVVLGLRAPPHLARKHERTPSAPTAGPGRPPNAKKPHAV